MGVIVDAIFGTGLIAAPREPFPEIAGTVNRAKLSGKISVVSIDLPSGLDCDIGRPLGPDAIRASMTVTFVARKKGFAAPATEQFTGEIVVSDIGCPTAAIDRAIAEA